MGKRAWIVLAALVLLSACQMSTSQRRRLEQRGIDPDSYEAGYRAAKQQEGLQEISEGLNGIHWTTPGHYYLQATRNDPEPAQQRCSVCLGHGYCRGALGVMGQCYACGGTGITP